LKQKVEKNIPIINEKIKAEKVQLIDHTGNNVGLVSRNEALRMAQDAELDLVLIAPRGKDGFPVTKIMDYGKLLYQKKKKQAEAKKHQKIIQIKEIKIRPKIDEHDFQTKLKHAAQFLKKGKRVKINLIFRGREMATKYERGKEMFEKIHNAFTELGISDFLFEKESKSGYMWSRIYFLKDVK